MTIWRGAGPLLLASTSPTRRALLEAAGLPVEAIAPDVDERAVEASMIGERPDPRDVARRLAAEKAGAVAARHPDRIVVGADQVLAIDGMSWGKPVSREAAADQLARLSGRTHLLHAAFALAQGGRLVVQEVATARLTMRALDASAVALYLDAAGDAGRRSAGGYEIESLGIHLFSRVEGDHSTILGLPLVPLLSALRRLGLLAF